jgi:hypothetical protein
MARIYSLLLLSALAACVSLPLTYTPPVSSPVNNDVNRVDPYGEGKAAVETFSQSAGCDSDSFREVIRSIQKIREEDRKFSNIAANPIASGYPYYIHSLQDFEKSRQIAESYRKIANEARQQHLELQFSLADKAKDKKCLDMADLLYRDIISAFVGEDYKAYRERARIGIDDVGKLKTNKRV